MIYIDSNFRTWMQTNRKRPGPNGLKLSKLINRQQLQPIPPPQTTKPYRQTPWSMASPCSMGQCVDIHPESLHRQRIISFLRCVMSPLSYVLASNTWMEPKKNPRKHWFAKNVVALDCHWRLSAERFAFIPPLRWSRRPVAVQEPFDFRRRIKWSNNVHQFCRPSPIHMIWCVDRDLSCPNYSPWTTC